MKRHRYLERIKEHFSVHSVCGLLGPRQCGKTTLALQFSQIFSGDVHRFDLENPDDLESLSNPMRILEKLKGLVIIDEIQRLPNLFPILRVLVDRQQAKYLVLGSASRDLLQQSSESLAGRIGYIELSPFHLKEGVEVTPLLIRGGFPLSYMAETDRASLLWRDSYIQTFLERDVPSLGFSVPPMQLRRFWMMLVHIHGQQLNVHQLGTSLGISGHTARSYLDILEGTFMMRILQPWFENISKRQVKTPKIYFRDTGILLALLKIASEEQLLHHPLLGHIWEGFALEQTLQALEIRREEAFYWRTSHGAELDLLIQYQGKQLGFEFKFADAPKRTKSMHMAATDLKLNHLYVIYPGKRDYSLEDYLSVISIESIKDFTF
ncbi:MAG: ATP-binding protein [Proteobacteria bacterium]|nr:ATP-binding protein [Pseudomonadota bacterium]